MTVKTVKPHTNKLPGVESLGVSYRQHKEVHAEIQRLTYKLSEIEYVIIRDLIDIGSYECLKVNYNRLSKLVQE
jgi:hypothetical protein